MSTFTRKLSVVTGASSGIGAVYADRLAKRGYDLLLVARREQRLTALAASIVAKYGVKAEPLGADLATEDGQSCVEAILRSNPDVHVLVNNAGIARLTPIADSPLDNSLAQISLNITALTRMAHAALSPMKARNAGVIINVSSVMALNSLAVSSVYSGTKAYVLAFTRGLQQELAGTALRIQAVLPAATATEVWDQSGVPLSALDPNTVMSVDDCVDAALSGLDKGESVTYPSVADLQMVERFESSRTELFLAAQTGRVAERYRSN